MSRDSQWDKNWYCRLVVPFFCEDCSLLNFINWNIYTEMGNMECPAKDAAHLASVARDICPFPDYNPSTGQQGAWWCNHEMTELSTHLTADCVCLASVCVYMCVCAGYMSAQRLWCQGRHLYTRRIPQPSCQEVLSTFSILRLSLGVFFFSF